MEYKMIGKTWPLSNYLENLLFNIYLLIKPLANSQKGILCDFVPPIVIIKISSAQHNDVVNIIKEIVNFILLDFILKIEKIRYYYYVLLCKITLSRLFEISRKIGKYKIHSIFMGNRLQFYLLFITQIPVKCIR